MGKSEDEFIEHIDDFLKLLTNEAREAEKSMSSQEIEQVKGFAEMASVFVDSVAKASDNDPKVLTYACSCALYEAIKVISDNNNDLSGDEYADLMCDTLDQIETNARLAVMMITLGSL